jgi:hypothetical protein
MKQPIIERQGLIATNDQGPRLSGGHGFSLGKSEGLRNGETRWNFPQARTFKRPLVDLGWTRFESHTGPVEQGVSCSTL